MNRSVLHVRNSRSVPDIYICDKWQKRETHLDALGALLALARLDLPLRQGDTRVVERPSQPGAHVHMLRRLEDAVEVGARGGYGSERIERRLLTRACIPPPPPPA